MTVISFNFTKINAEKIKGIKGKLNISNNVSIKAVNSFDLKLGKNKEKALRFDFKFESVYDPKIGNIEILGEVAYLGKEANIKEAEKQWKKDKKIPKDIVEEIMTSILSKCNIEALLMSKEIGLPPPIPLPKVKSD
tara:strand:+ start:140 stop:547 length:408 start_codon:yes stop_codon:yes gene_type:complete